MSIFTQYKERAHTLLLCSIGYDAGPGVFKALQVIVEMGAKGEELENRIRELEAENADLRERVADLEQELELKKYEMLDLMERC